MQQDQDKVLVRVATPMPSWDDLMDSPHSCSVSASCPWTCTGHRPTLGSKSQMRFHYLTHGEALSFG
eukprot:6447716-Amphidinium_carterae.1